MTIPIQLAGAAATAQWANDVTGIVNQLTDGYISNANGSSLRLPDGTQIAWRRATLDTAIDTAYGSGSVYIGSVGFTFPQTFSVPPAVAIGEAKWGTGASWGSVTALSSGGFTVRLHDFVSRASGSTVVSWIAIGRWA